MPPEPANHPADTALSLLFRKLHPLLEDAAHLQARAAPAAEFERLHRRLQGARHKVVEVLDGLAEGSADEELAAQLEALAANLTPVGEPLRQALILTQLCLEQAPKDLVGFLPAGAVAAAAVMIATNSSLTSSLSCFASTRAAYCLILRLFSSSSAKRSSQMMPARNISDRNTPVIPTITSNILSMRRSTVLSR